MARTILLTLCCIHAFGCGGNPGDPPNIDFAKLKPLVAGVREAKSLILYEGLPHQGYDGKSLEQELMLKKTVRLHDFPFYAETRPLKDADAKKLSDLFCAGDSFVPWRGMKACGGFHPDYCLEWHVGEGHCHVLVCLGCCEIKCYSPRAKLYCDIESKALDQFREIFQPYRKNRPAYKPEQ